MRDFPFFTTENGVAGVTLSRIPYTKEAYITLHQAPAPQALLNECVAFCLAAGAETVYATGKGMGEGYPLHTRILRLQCPKESLSGSDAALFPVQAHTFERWRELYNERMRGVSHAAFLKQSDKESILKSAGAYFVHRDQTLLGIGLVEGEAVKAVASVIPGMGETVLLALCELITADTVTLEVSEDNGPAMAIYKRLGFLPVGEVCRWYRVK